MYLFLLCKFENNNMKITRFILKKIDFSYYVETYVHCIIVFWFNIIKKKNVCAI